MQLSEMSDEMLEQIASLSESRICKISKDDLRMVEEQLLWSDTLEQEVYKYWTVLNGFWKTRKLPKCTCGDFESGFMAREQYNPFFYKDEPCSLIWLQECKEKGLLKI